MIRRIVAASGLAVVLLLASGCKKEQPARPAPASPKPYSIGIFQSVDSPTANEVRKGILQALKDGGLREGENVTLHIRIAAGDLSEVQRIAQEFARENIDLVIPLSTQCLQAALVSGRTLPIVFGSVATPFLVGAGRSAADHLPNVTGVTSTGPVRQTIRFIHEVLPKAKRIGTLWTPSEVNSEYYLNLAREAASELNMDIVDVPIADAHEIPQSADILVNEKVEVLFPISDNTINSSFEVLGPVADENHLPLFGGFSRAVEFGACAALGFDFYDMGYKTGRMALRVMHGENPARIPIQMMEDVKVFINLDAGARQGVVFSKEILARAGRVIRGSAGAAVD